VWCVKPTPTLSELDELSYYLQVIIQSPHIGGLQATT
jgi:hypothetical protein